MCSRPRRCSPPNRAAQYFVQGPHLLLLPARWLRLAVRHTGCIIIDVDVPAAISAILFAHYSEAITDPIIVAIVHGLNDIIRDLDVLQQSRLPDACRRALYETGPHLREFHRREMASEFKDPTGFTLRSVRYRVDPERLSLTLSISQDGTPGQAPANFLEPVFRVGASTRGTALTTRFSKRLQRAGVFTPGTHLVPITGARHAETRRGRMSQAVYQAALGQLRANEFARGKQRSRGRYFAINNTSTSTLQPGIYREKNGSISRLFALLDSPPSVPRTYDWSDASIDEAVDQLEGRIMKHLRWL